MSEYCFGVSTTRPTRAIARKLERIARRHGAVMIEIEDPGSGYKRWFVGPNRGDPFDRALADAVAADVDREIPEARPAKTRKTRTRRKPKTGPHWFGRSAPLHGTPAIARSLRVTDAIWAQWRTGARVDGKSCTQWLHDLAARRIAEQATKRAK